MANKNCLYCKHYHPDERVQDGFERHFGIFMTPKYKIVPAHCDCDNDRCMKWWRDNGHLKSPESEDLDCFEPTKAQLTLEELNADLDAILEKVKEVNAGYDNVSS